MPVGDIIEIWKDHRYDSGKNAGQIVKALPSWSDKRGGYDVYPSNSNELADSEVVRTLDQLWAKLTEGLRVRCIVPENGDTPILTGPFKAVIQQKAR